MEQDKVIPLDTQRRLVAYQTAKSWEEVPHVAYLYEPDATELYQAYLRRREELSGQGLRLTLNTLLLKAVGRGPESGAPAGDPAAPGVRGGDFGPSGKARRLHGPAGGEGHRGPPVSSHVPGL